MRRSFIFFLLISFILLLLKSQVKEAPQVLSTKHPKPERLNSPVSTDVCAEAGQSCLRPPGCLSHRCRVQLRHQLCYIGTGWGCTPEQEALLCKTLQPFCDTTVKAKDCVKMHSGDITGHTGRQYVNKKNQLGKVFWSMWVPRGTRRSLHEKLWCKVR